MIFFLFIVGLILVLVAAFAPTPYPWGRVLMIVGIICLVVSVALFLFGYFTVHDPVVGPAAMTMLGVS